jgi:hypothetical protein
VGRLSSDDLEDDDLDLPQDEALDDDGAVGVDDADELLLQDLRDEPEDVGLDTESVGGGDALATQLLDLQDDETDDPSDDAPLEIDADIDAEGDEHGWTEDSEGGAENEPWDEGLTDDLDDGLAADGGEEGVDDPLLDGLPDDLPRRPDEDADDEEGVADGSLDDLVREIGTDA